jgi:hypothetical protein
MVSVPFDEPIEARSPSPTYSLRQQIGPARPGTILALPITGIVQSLIHLAACILPFDGAQPWKRLLLGLLARANPHYKPIGELA